MLKMREAIINKSMLYIKKNCSYDEIKLAEIKYGLEAIYILITKSIVILSCAFILGIFKEVVIFTLSYSIIRAFSFGLHATKSWICLVSSLISFITIPFLCKFVYLDIYGRSIIGILNIIFIFKNSPADTYKKPIVNKKRREIYKLLSTSISIIMTFISIIINYSFISNCLLFALILQNLMISPTIYRLFKLPYNNYKNYLYNN